MDYKAKNSVLHKSFDITVTNITENNKNKKLEQVQKSLEAIAENRPFIINHIPADNSRKYGDITLRINNFDRSKIEKAVHKMAFSLGADLKAGSKGEAFLFKAQEELNDLIIRELTEKTQAVYNFVISYFRLPEMRIISKSEKLTYKGKILYDPETGKAIKKSDWDNFVKELYKFLEKTYKGTGERIILTSETLGRILEKMSKTHSFEQIKKMKLSELEVNHRKLDWISSTAQNMKDMFGETVQREQAARIEVATQSAAIKVTKVTDTMRNDIQDIIIDGVKNKQSKSVVSQKLFDKCSNLNRDFQRIADTEIQNTVNEAYLKESVYNTEEGEKVYFKRFEILDGNTCAKCRAIKGAVALWSDIPLPYETIDDEYAKFAIWEGKSDGKLPVNTLHPWCRGSWYRYYPEAGSESNEEE